MVRNHTADGIPILGGQCRPCYRTQKRLLHALNRDKDNAYHRDWRAAHREEINAYDRARYTADPVPKRLRNRRRRLQYPLQKQAEGRQYRATLRGKEVARTAFARRKARKRDLPVAFTTDDWAYALSYWHYACVVCGAQDGLLHILAQEHWIALSHPACPGTVATNILPLCDGRWGCNQRKGTKDGQAFLSMLGVFANEPPGKPVGLFKLKRGELLQTGLYRDFDMRSKMRSH